MNKVQLRQIIKEIVVRKLRELDMNKPDIPNESGQATSNLSNAEEKELEKLNKVAADLNAKQQELNGKKADLEGKIRPSIQRIERDLGPVNKKLGVARRKIQNIKDKV